MIKFRKNFSKLLPYNRRQYIKYLNDSGSSIEWYGISFQSPAINGESGITSQEFTESYEYLFKKIVLKFDNRSFWIVNHDDKDLEWLPNNDDNLTHLRSLFKKNSVPNSFKGALILSVDALLDLSRDLISYPHIVLNKAGFLYKDLDISHGELQLVIKISGHLNIDFLSTDKGLLREVVNENSPNLFIIKEYRGTTID
jgi:hypothetical protein